MSTLGSFASLCGLAVVAACGHRPAPGPAAEVARDSSCAQSDSGIALGQDVSRRPRYRVDSSGRVETLPPVPTAATDTAKRRCPALPDSSVGSKQ